MKRRIGIFTSPPFLLMLLLLVQFIIYAPHVGKGFISDDFTWLENVVPDGEVDYIRPFRETTGFFRPLVGISFGLQFQLHGMEPRAFGFFNLFLHLLNIILVYLLLAHWWETRPYAIWAAAIFALNAKGVNMAVGWISGRTTLLFSFFLLLSLYLYLKLSKKNPLRYLLTALFYFAALLSKETAAAAPVFIFLLILFGFGDGNKSTSFFQRLKSGINSILVFVLPLAIYFLLRFNSDAMSPLNAPAVYSYSFSPWLILKNLSEYVIRAGLLDFYIILLFLFIMMVFFVLTGAKEEEEEKTEISSLFPGITWFLVFLLPLLPIPVRSDLYVYLPQLGLHVAALTFIIPLWRKLNIKRGLKRSAVRLLICLLALVWAGYLFLSAVPYGERGAASNRFSEQVVFAVYEIPPGSGIVIIDKEYGGKYSPARLVSYGFNSLLNLYYPEKKFKGEIVTPDFPVKKGSKQRTYFFIWQDGSLKKHRNH